MAEIGLEEAKAMYPGVSWDDRVKAFKWALGVDKILKMSPEEIEEYIITLLKPFSCFISEDDARKGRLGVKGVLGAQVLVDEDNHDFTGVVLYGTDSWDRLARYLLTAGYTRHVPDNCYVYGWFGQDSGEEEVCCRTRGQIPEHTNISGSRLSETSLTSRGEEAVATRKLHNIDRIVINLVIEELTELVEKKTGSKTLNVVAQSPKVPLIPRNKKKKRKKA